MKEKNAILILLILVAILSIASYVSYTGQFIDKEAGRVVQDKISEAPEIVTEREPVEQPISEPDDELEEILVEEEILIEENQTVNETIPEELIIPPQQIFGLATDYFQNYQEDADETNYTGAWVSVTNINDSDWGTEGHAQTAGFSSYYYVNYTKPTDAVGADWRGKGSSGTFDVTVPSNCWSAYSNKIVLRVESYYQTSIATSWTTWQCFNGLSWSTLNTTSVFGGSGGRVVYEEAVLWNMTTDITVCQNLVQGNQVYELQNDITSGGSGSACFTSFGSNIVIDGKGYKLDTTGATNGIYLTGLTNVTIKNIIIEGHGSAILLNNCDDVILYNVSTTGNSANSLWMNAGGDNVTVSNSYFNGSGSNVHLLQFGDVSNITLTHNILNNSGYAGIFLDNSNFSFIYNNTLDNCGETDWGAIALDDSDYNNITNNTINSGGASGLYVRNSENNIFVNNTIADSGYGINLATGAINNIYENNNVSFSTLWDIFSSVNVNMTNLTMNKTFVNFESGNGINIKSVRPLVGNDPPDYLNIGHFLNMTNKSANSWIYINISYLPSDVPLGTIEPSIRLHRLDSVGYTYQENPDENKSYGTWDGTGTSDNSTDGDWSTYGVVLVSGSRIELNYTKPYNSIGAVWRVKSGTSERNISIPFDCFNAYGDKLVLNVTMSNSAPYVRWNCWNGTELKQLASDTVDSNFYEEAIYWEVGAWTSYVGTPNSVNTIQNYTYTNVSNFGSIFAPMGETSDVSDCRNLTQNNTVYTVIQNLTDRQTGWNKCIYANNLHNITLDCAGYNITDVIGSSAFGIYIDNSTNMTIVNCSIYNYDDVGIKLWGCNNTSILNNTVKNATGISFVDINTGYHDILYNYVYNTNNAISVGNRIGSISQHNNISYNIVDDCNNDGIHIAAIYTNISYNNITSADYAIYVEDYDNNTVDHNIINESYNRGIIVEGSNNDVVIFNEIRNALNLPIQLNYVDNTNVSNNYMFNITTSGSYGYFVYVYYSDFNNFTNNTLIDADTGASSFVSGFELENSHNNTFDLNKIYNITGAAILLRGANSSVFVNNTIYNTTGIDFLSSETAVVNAKNEIINLNLNDTNISFTFAGNFNLSYVAQGESEFVAGYEKVNHHINITNTSSNPWVYLNISYTADDVTDMSDNSTLRIWKNASGGWNRELNLTTNFVEGVDTTEQYVYANITNFSSVFAPMGENTDVGDCKNLTTSNVVYNLINNLTDTQTNSSICLYVNVSDVILNCTGYNISKIVKGGYGIYIENVDNVTLIDCNVQDYESAQIYVKNSTDINITNSDLENGGAGLKVDNVNDSVFVNVNLSNDYLVIKGNSTGNVYTNLFIDDAKTNITSDANVLIDSVANPGLNTVYYNVVGDFLEVENAYNANETFGDIYDDYGFSIEQTNDDGFIIAATEKNSDYASNIKVIKLSPEGKLIFNKTFGNISRNDYGFDVKQADDGGYFVFGLTSLNTASNNYTFWLIKLAPNGTEEWNETYGSRAQYRHEYNREGVLIKTSDGGYLMAGASLDATGCTVGTTNLQMFKVNSSGDIEWKKAFCSGGSASLYTVIHGGKQTSDGGFIFAGQFHWGTSGEDGYAIKVNGTGSCCSPTTYRCRGVLGSDNVFAQTFGSSNQDEIFYDVIVADDNQYVFTGEESTIVASWESVWLHKINETGHQNWSLAFGKTSEQNYGYGLQQTSDGGFIISGEHEGSSHQEMWLIKTNVMGTEQWNKTYFLRGGGSGALGHVSGKSVVETDDGYAVVGFDAAITVWEDIWFLKTDLNGDITVPTGWLYLNINYDDTLAIDENNVMMYKYNSSGLSTPDKFTDGTYGTNTGIDLVWANITHMGSIFEPAEINTSIAVCRDITDDNVDYTLIGNLVDNQSDSTWCIYISGDNITLDCDGYDITNVSGGDYGIYINDSYNITLRNCNISYYDEDGILINNSDKIEIINSNFTENGNGINLDDIEDTIIFNSIFQNQTYDGIHIEDSNYLNVSDNILNESDGSNIYMLRSENNSIAGNDFTYGENGLYCQYCNYTNVTDNLLEHNTQQLYFDNSYGNNFTNNIALYGDIGIYLSNSQDNSLNNDTANNNNYGVYLVDSSNNNFTINNATNNSIWDFYSDYSTNNRFLNLTTNNTMSSFSYAGNLRLKSALDVIVPSGYYDIGHFLNITNTSVGWMYINVSYVPGDITGGVVEANLKLFKNISGTWTSDVGTPNTVNTGSNYIYANITNFSSIFAPLDVVDPCNLDREYNMSAQLTCRYGMNITSTGKLNTFGYDIVVDGLINITGYLNATGLTDITPFDSGYNIEINNGAYLGSNRWYGNVDGCQSIDVYSGGTLNATNDTISIDDYISIEGSYDYHNGSIVIDVVGSYTTTTRFATASNVKISKVTSPPSDGINLVAIGYYVNITNLTVGGGFGDDYFNITYTDLDAINESNLSMFRYNGSEWTQNGIYDTNVNTSYNWVWANISSFSVFAPMEFVFQCINITTDNLVYDLGANLSGIQSGWDRCVYINASNVTFDCHGYNITGVGVSDYYGIFVTGDDNTIKNCTITNYGDSLASVFGSGGVFFNDTNNSEIIDCNVSYNTHNGITTSEYSNYTDVINNTIDNNDGSGIRIGKDSVLDVYTIQNNLYGNNVTSSQGHGIRIDYLIDSIFENNIIYNSQSDNVYVSYGIDNTFYRNNMSHSVSNNGINCQNCNQTNITDNNISDNYLGVFLFDTYDSFIDLNNISYNDFSGIFSNSSLNNSFVLNDVYYNSEYGINILDSNFTNILNNTVTYNTEAGIVVNSSLGSYIYNVTVKYNNVSFNGR